MPGLRDHEPIVIENFNGVWARGDSDTVPSDHFIVADNVQYFASGFETRDPLDKYLDAGVNKGQVLRVYNYVMQTGQSLLILTEGGKIYHAIGKSVVHGPILTIPAMQDFGFVAYNGRAYITPFVSTANPQGVFMELGIKNEFLYVYKGDGTPARKAAGPPPTGPTMVATNEGAGMTDIGDHLIAVVYETDTGFLTALGPEVFTKHTFTGTNKIKLTGIPISPNPYVKKRHIVATKWIPEYNGDQKGYQFFFVPGGNIDDNTTTEKIGDFFDADLLADASHLIDNFSEIPAGVSLTIYHSRLVIVGENGTTESLKDNPPEIPDNRSLARVSHAGEPEAISKVDGLIIVPLDGNALTNCQEFRDVLYIFKKSRTYGYSDNNDEPATWQEETLDQGVGAPVHGIAMVLDSGGVSVDFLLVADWSGLMLFNGTYARPELSFKIEDYWMQTDRNLFRHIQIVNDSLSKKIWITFPPPIDMIVFHADYGEGLDAQKIKWARWIFDARVSTITLIDTKTLIIGVVGNVVV